MVSSIVGDVFASGSTVGPLVSLLWPSGIVAGDTLVLVCLNNNGTALTGTGGSGTGIGVPAGFTQLGSDHAYSSSMAIRVWTKTAVGGESGVTPGCTWGGGSGGSASRTWWGAFAIPATWTLQGVAWNDQATLTNASVTVPAYSHTGNDTWFTLGLERGSSPSTAFSATPAGCTLVEQTFGTSSGACSGGWATADAVDTDGSVGAGTWTTNTANSAGRVAATFVATIPVPATVAGGVSSLTLTALAGTVSINAAATVAGGVSALTLTALAGTVVAGGAATVSGGVCSITLTALAGVVSRQATVAGGVAALTLAAPKGTPGPVSSDVVSSISYPAVAAHRGAAGVKPQETMTAFTYAAALSDACALEMDVQVNASGSLVLWHDDDVDAVGVNSSGVAQTGLVTSKTDTNWNALCVKWPAGFTGPAPAAAAYWRDIVATYRNSGRVLLPEIKATAAGAPLVASIVANGMQGQCIVQSFDATDLTQVVAAGIDAMLLDDSPNYTTMVAAGIGHVAIAEASVTPTLCTNAHAVGIKVWSYTPNTVSARDALIAEGVDGFITNKPATLLPNFVDGELVTITVTALAGTASAQRAATITAAPAALTVTALAGTVDAQRAATVAGGVCALTVTAPAGSVVALRAATVTAAPATITLEVQPGAVLTAGAATVGGETANIDLTALSGTVDAHRAATVAGSAAQVTLTPLAGTISTGATVAGGVAAITLTTPAGQVVATQAATIAGLTAQVQLEAMAGLVFIDTGEPTGRILSARLRIPTARGRLRIPTARGDLR